VDDDAALLDGLKLHLRRQFDVVTATTPQQALSLLQSRGPFAAVLSDLGMPEMDGAEFLRRAREVAPDTVRLLLTGQNEAESAIAAVNEGQIFRFLLKPCRPAVLLDAVQKAVEQYQLLNAERVLLDQTLRGCVNALTDVLAVSQPLAFGRACRVRHHIRQLLVVLKPRDSWQIEIAAMLSQIGMLTLPPTVVEKLYYGLPLSTEEQTMVARLSHTSERMLRSIPRLDNVRSIFLRQHERYSSLAADQNANEVVRLGAALLRMVMDFDVLEAQGSTVQHAIAELRQRAGCYDAKLLHEFENLLSAEQRGSLDVPLEGLAVGMTFAADVQSSLGALLFARGHEITEAVYERIRNLPRESLPASVKIYRPWAARIATAK
jgi:response regulator RpfG family c-di-GMP phosphodiesterase